MNIAKSGGTIFAALLMVASISSADARSSYKGKVTKQNARLARPVMQAQPASTAPLQSGVNDDSFVLNAKQFETQLNENEFGPWSALLEAPKFAKSVPMGAGVTNGSAAPVAVDFQAIENAYAEAIPRVTPPPITGGTESGGALSAAPITPDAVAAAANARYAAMHGELIVRQNALAARGAGVMLADTCVCDTAIPSTACTISRIQGHGTNMPAMQTPGVMVPGMMAPTVSPPMTRRMMIPAR